MATEFEKAIGWNERKLSTVIGCDLTVVENGEERRGPINNVNVFIDGQSRFLTIGFTVSWVALKEQGEWRLEAEASDPEKGIKAFAMNPDFIVPRTNHNTFQIEIGKAQIHRGGDNLPKPQRPTDKPANYIHEP